LKLSERPLLHHLYALLGRVLGEAGNLMIERVAAHIAEAIDGLTKLSPLLTPQQLQNLDDE